MKNKLDSKGFVLEGLCLQCFYLIYSIEQDTFECDKFRMKLDGKVESCPGFMPIAEGLSSPTSGWNYYAVSQTGSLAYSARPTGEGGMELVWVDRSGDAQEIDPAWRVAGDVLSVSLTLSPGGTRLAISKMDSQRFDLWVKQLDSGPARALTFEGSINRRATWSPDGRVLTFLSNRAGQYDIWTRRADGSGIADLVLDWEQGINEVLYSADNRWLIFRDALDNIYAVPLATDSVPVPLVATEFNERYIALSPDDRWLAYVSNARGREEVYVRPFPEATSTPWLVSTDGGTEPLWAHSGRELFYRNLANELVVVPVSADPSFAWDSQEVLFSMADYLSADGFRQYDVSPDDQRFVMLRTAGGDAFQLIVVQNLFEELKRLGN